MSQTSGCWSKALLAACLFFGTRESVVAQSAQLPVYGVGATQCSTFLSDLQTRETQRNALYFSWAEGFITASNALLNSSEYPPIKNLTSKIDLDAQQRLLVELCTAKPSQDFSRAAMELLDRLREAEGLKPVLR
jgi:hypothetical protein